MNAKRAKNEGRISVANYVSQQIDLSEKKQKDIAEELDYDNANMVTMIKQGRTKVPINRITQWARALGIDTMHFFRLVMMEYHPQTWEAIEQVIGNYTVTKNELEILDIIREFAKGQDVVPADDEEKQELAALVEKWKKKREDDAELARVGELHRPK